MYYNNDNDNNKDGESWNRRRFLLLPSVATRTTTAGAAVVVASGIMSSFPSIGVAATTMAPMLGGSRVEEIGGGFDILTPQPLLLKSSDAFFPASCCLTVVDNNNKTSWNVQRAVTSVEGDVGQAGVVWKALGGDDLRSFTDKLTEVYEARFVPSPNDDATYVFDDGKSTTTGGGGKTLRSSVLDRGYDIASRCGGTNVSWDAQNGGDLSYTTKSSSSSSSSMAVMELKVMQRKNDSSEQGFGSDELIRIHPASNSIFGDLYRVARVKRRFRRDFDANGNRIIEGLEIVTTYRVLDGIAGIEMPTSTCRSRIRMTAP